MDWITAEHIGQLAVVILAISTFLKQINDSKNAAKKDQLTEALGRIISQNKRIEKLEKKIDKEIESRVKLMDYIGTLQRIMRAAGLHVPEMPVIIVSEDEDEDESDKAKTE